MGILSTGAVHVHWNGLTADNVINSNSGDLPLNQLKYVVFTYDRVNGKIYVDGILRAMEAETRPIPTDPTYALQVGRRPNSTLYYNGLIDEVRIYNRALSDAEIKALYDATK